MSAFPAECNGMADITVAGDNPIWFFTTAQNIRIMLALHYLTFAVSLFTNVRALNFEVADIIGPVPF